MQQWFVLRSKPNKEAFLCKQLEAYGIEVYLPQVKTMPVNPRAKNTRPYFTGYLFVRLDLKSIGFSLLQWMPYSLGLISFGGNPSTIPDELIHIIQKQTADFKTITPRLQSIQHGDLVTVERGPFAGYKALFDMNLSGTERARILLLLLQNKQLTINLPVNYLRLQHA